METESRNPYRSFLESLLFDGVVSLSSNIAPNDSQVNQATDVLCDFEKKWRVEMPGNCPMFDLEVGNWAGFSFFRACQFLYFRDIGPDEVAATFSIECPMATTPAKHYSVDLVFRFLPDLWRIAKTLSSDDLLTKQLRRWCFEWPISSVGIDVGILKNKDFENMVDSIDMDSRQSRNLDSPQPRTSDNIVGDPPDLEPSKLDEIVNDPFLMHIYCERIIEFKDKSRISNPFVNKCLRSMAGAYPQLIEKDIQSASVQETLGEK